MLKAHLLSRLGRPPWAGRAARCRGNSPKRAAAALKGAEGALPTGGGRGTRSPPGGSSRGHPSARWGERGRAFSCVNCLTSPVRLLLPCSAEGIHTVFSSATDQGYPNSASDGWTPAAGVRTPRLAPQHSNMSSAPQAASALPAPTCAALFLDSELQEKFFLADVNEASSFSSC